MLFSQPGVYFSLSSVGYILNSSFKTQLKYHLLWEALSNLWMSKAELTFRPPLCPLHTSNTIPITLHSIYILTHLSPPTRPITPLDAEILSDSSASLVPKTVLTRDIQWIFDGVGSRGTENMKGDRKTQVRWPEEWRIVVFISTTIFGHLLFP